jgi:cytochrome c2
MTRGAWRGARAVASLPDFAYSSGLKALPARGDRTWIKAALDAFLASPEDLASGAAKNVVGMPAAGQHADVMAHRASHAARPE